MNCSHRFARWAFTGCWLALFGTGVWIDGQPVVGQEASGPVPILAASQAIDQGNLNAKKPVAVDSSKANLRKAQEPVPDARVAELMSFVEANHPEIRPLLRSLQRKRPVQFENAMRTLDREVRNLQLLKDRSPDRYRRSLDQWVNRSKTKLLAAQLAVTKSGREATRIRKQMTALINQYFDSRADQLKEDIEALETRSSRLKKTLETMEEKREQEVKRQFDLLTRGVPQGAIGSGPPETPKPKPAVKPEDRRKANPGSEGGSGK